MPKIFGDKLNNFASPYSKRPPASKSTQETENLFDYILDQVGPYVQQTPMSQPYSSQGFPLVQQQLIGGVSMYDRKKTTTFKKAVPLSKRVNMEKNVVTYIWHSQTPSYAKYGGIAIPNYYSDTGTDGAGGTNVTNNADMEDALGDQVEDLVTTGGSDWMHFPAHLYDITAAPNYVHPSAASEDNPPTGNKAQGIAESTAGGYATGVSRLPVRNPCVAYSLFGQFKDQGTTAASYDKTMYRFLVTNRLVSQEPDGRLGRNKWYLRYMKKPYLLSPSALYPQAAGLTASLTDSNSLTDNYRDMCPAGLKLTDTGVNTRSVYTPPVGPKPIHLSTKVNMCLVGTNHSEVEYDISVIRFKDDALLPNESWHDSVSQVLGDAANAAPYILNDSNYYVGGGENQTQQNSTAACLTWQNLLLPYTHGPHTKGNTKVLDKYVQVLGTRRVKIAPKLVVEGDTTLNHTYVQFKLNWNEIRSFVWRDQNDQGQIESLPEYGTAPNKHGPGFATRIASANACHTSPSPRSRLFILVRCRSDLRGGFVAGAPQTSQTVDGRSIGTFEAEWTPTYDISIENSWIPDPAVPIL